MSLTDTQIRNVRPGPRQQKLFDGGGLFLLVVPSGGKRWRLKYRFGGKEKLLALGTYPDVSLKDARDRRDNARKLLAEGTDPSEQRKAAKTAQAEQTANTFETVAREWFMTFAEGRAQNHSRKVIQRLEQNIFPWIGSRPVGSIAPPALLEVVQRIADRGALDTAHRAVQSCGQIFRYAITRGLTISNPAADLRGALPKLKAKGNFAAITDPQEFGGLLRAIEGYLGWYAVRYALRLLPLVFVRPGELRFAEWGEFDFDRDLWVIPASRMKAREEHLIPMSKQTRELLLELRGMYGGAGLVFPGVRHPSKPISENTLVLALRSMGYAQGQMTAHGFRASARTMLDERLHVDPVLIEHQLSHVTHRGSLGSSYNRTAHLEKRRAMMQQWADYLDGLKAGGGA